MTKSRLEAFSDGVIAIIITIMVLELKVPRAEGHDPSLSDLRPILPVFGSYILSFIYVGIYWNNHHHMLHAATKVSGAVLWANLHLLFWLSLFPFTTDWMGENHFARVPTAMYGAVLLLAGIAYVLLQAVLLHLEGPGSTLARAVGRDRKGKASLLLYAAAIPCAFLSPWISSAIYLAVAMMWLIPDRRIEHALRHGSLDPH